MKNFKSFLNESAISNAIKTFDATKLDFKDIEAAILNAGIDMGFEGYTQMVYSGYVEKSKQHKYHVLWDDQDEEEGESFAISDFYVYLGKDGKIEADSGGMPVASQMSKDNAVKKLASLKSK